MDPVIMLTLDVEEFDAPLDKGHDLSFQEQIDISRRGMEAVMERIDSIGVRTTLFTTARFAESEPELIQQASQKHEIASHGLNHGSFERSDLLESKKRLEAISRQAIIGFRRPRLQWTDPQDILDAGYVYNSSMSPTWIPGRYNNLDLPRTIYRENGLVQMPVSVTPGLRIPLFWLLMKNIPLGLYRKFLRRTLQKDGYLNLYFHPWEFVDTGKLLPRYTSRYSGPRMIERLATCLWELAEHGRFQAIGDFVDQKLRGREAYVSQGTSAR
ncbi:MAG: polysaccharide deacetylase [Phycisphaerae bacterium]|nr:polysaccharide deacetylase [Phycisphaerae bacterium]